MSSKQAPKPAADKIDADCRRNPQGSWVPTITVHLPACLPDDTEAWNRRDLLAAQLRKDLCPEPFVEESPVYDDFENLCRELMRWMAHNQHPHTHLTITATSAELSEGIRAINTTEYLVD